MISKQTTVQSTRQDTMMNEHALRVITDKHKGYTHAGIRTIDLYEHTNRFMSQFYNKFITAH